MTWLPFGFTLLLLSLGGCVQGPVHSSEPDIRARPEADVSLASYPQANCTSAGGVLLMPPAPNEFPGFKNVVTNGVNEYRLADLRCEGGFRALWGSWPVVPPAQYRQTGIDAYFMSDGTITEGDDLVSTLKTWNLTGWAYGGWVNRTVLSEGTLQAGDSTGQLRGGYISVAWAQANGCQPVASRVERWFLVNLTVLLKPKFVGAFDVHYSGHGQCTGGTAAARSGLDAPWLVTQAHPGQARTLDRLDLVLRRVDLPPYERE